MKKTEVKRTPLVQKAVEEKRAASKTPRRQKAGAPKARTPMWQEASKPLPETRVAVLKQSMLKSAKLRAAEKKVPFALGADDIHIPEVCPILGIRLLGGVGMVAAGSPSLDRLDPKQGYVVGNVAVISHRANRIKGDATLGELRKLVEWMEARGAR